MRRRAGGAPGSRRSVQGGRALAWARALAPALVLCAAGCARGGAQPADVRIEEHLAPDPPVVGPATLDLVITDAAGAPVRAARVAVEGDMTHPGMAPSIARVAEVGPGRYRAELEFTMAGDWVLFVKVELEDGSRAERMLEVPAVGR